MKGQPVTSRQERSEAVKSSLSMRRVLEDGYFTEQVNVPDPSPASLAWPPHENKRTKPTADTVMMTRQADFVRQDSAEVAHTPPRSLHQRMRLGLAVGGLRPAQPQATDETDPHPNDLRAQ